MSATTSFARLLLVALGCLSVTPAVADDMVNSPPNTGNAGDDHPITQFFGKMGKAVSDGIDNGTQMSGAVKVLGYVMAYSKLANSNQRAYCLANPETGKIITVAPTFGRPYLRGDGTTGFVQTVYQTDPHHAKLEVNVAGTLPGNTCADLVRNNGLTIEGVAVAKSQPASPAAGSGDAACASHGGLDAVVNDIHGRSFWECRDGSRQRIAAGQR